MVRDEFLLYKILLTGSYGGHRYRDRVAEERDDPQSATVAAAYSEPVELGQEPPSGLGAGLWQNLRYAFRMLLRQPGVTVVAVVTMALGIGVTTTIFSVQLLAFRPFGFANQGRWLWFESSNPRPVSPAAR